MLASQETRISTDPEKTSGRATAVKMGKKLIMRVASVQVGRETNRRTDGETSSAQEGGRVFKQTH